MSILIMTRVFTKRFGSCTRKAIAVKLADHADDEGKGIWPSLARLAASCDVSESTARRTLADFVSEGLLRLVKEGGNGPGSTNRYDFDLAVLEAMPGALEVAQSAQEKGVTVTPLENAKGLTGDNKGVTDNDEGCHRDTQTIREPSDNHHSQPRASATVPPDGGERKVIADLEDQKKPEQRLELAWWKLINGWPNLTGFPSEKGKRVFAGMSEEDRSTAVAKRDAWLAMLKQQRRDYVPTPATYLRERLFESVADAATATVASVELAPFGKAWMSWRLYLLATLPARQWRPTPMQQRLAAEGMGHLFDDNRRNAKYPLVHALDIDAERGLGRRLKPGEEAPDADSFVRIKRGSDEWHAWQHWHQERDWPWINPPKHVEWVFVPSSMPSDGEATGAEQAA
jgi:hypothetical protein